jgi:hypothetical protein
MSVSVMIIRCDRGGEQKKQEKAKKKQEKGACVSICDFVPVKQGN